jgi:hypothetical protein
MNRPEENLIEIDDVCVYTIISRERLIQAASNGETLPEKTRWVTAEKLFQQGRQLPVVLPTRDTAENCSPGAF